MSASARFVIVACPPDRATAIATALVEQRLAACVSVQPGWRSVYRWRDAIESADESLLLIKTRAECYPALESAVRSLHPYELPEIVGFDASSGLPDYLGWIRDCTTP